MHAWRDPLRKGVYMLAKAYAKKLNGGNGYRRVLFFLHFFLWLAVTLVAFFHLVEKLITLNIEALSGLPEIRWGGVNSLGRDILSVIADLLFGKLGLDRTEFCIASYPANLYVACRTVTVFSYNYLCNASFIRVCIAIIIFITV